MKNRLSIPTLFILKCIFFITVQLASGSAIAEESYCAKVKIEILQELTLERQGFEATMRISNGLDTFALEDIEVDILFQDENENTVVATSDPNADSADFYIRLDDTENISGLAQLEKGSVAGGKVEPSTEGVIKWLIIPVPGAAKDSPTGKLYFVGAKLKYSYGGTDDVVEVVPDTIIVKPQPQLTLDYFLTEHVFGDDAFTEIIEPVEPYTLGIRIANNGFGIANNVKLDSAQPRIVENEQGLSIGFNISGSYVNDSPAEPSLLLDFGDIPASGRTTGRWIMESTLSGKFIEFSASVSHAAEYGGELTSLIHGANTHFLVRDVQVDLQGRDEYKDFLAHDGNPDQLRVFESQNLGITEETCDDCSSVFKLEATLSSVTETPNGSEHTLMPASQEPAFVFIKVPDPYQGNKVLSHVTRSDGKRLLEANAWLGKERNEDKINFDHFLYIFDQQNTSEYSVVFNDSSATPQAPVIQFISDKVTYEGSQVGFLVRASDANGDDVNVTIQSMPLGGEFNYEMGQPVGKGIFSWEPQFGQAGNYPITFIANDGGLVTEFTMYIKVNPADDIDGDGMLDEWELLHFGDLSRDGTGDYDQDGFTDLEEFEKGWNPKEAAKVPNVPTIVSPIFDGETSTLTPDLVFDNSAHSSDIDVTYTIEVYSDAAMTDQVALLENIEEGTNQTSVLLSSTISGEPLSDNHHYYWRVKGVSTEGNSEWAIGQFFINTVNDAPTAPVAQNPVNDEIVSQLQPTLNVANSTDVDLDDVSYGFKLFDSSADLSSGYDGIDPLFSIDGLSAGENGYTAWVIPEALAEDTSYQWIVVAKDEHGLESSYTVNRFLVSTQNDGPSAPVLSQPSNQSEVESLAVELAWINGTDPEGAALEYEVEWDIQSDFASQEKQSITAIDEQDELTQQVISLDSSLDNSVVFWRVRSSDGELFSSWIAGQFFVNTVNDAPTSPTLANPANGSTVEVVQPTLSVNSANDIDGDTINYRFEVYSDSGLSDLISTVSQLDTVWQLPTQLSDNKTFYWRVRAEDEHGAESAWSDRYAFFVNKGGINDEPQFAFVLPNEDVELTDGDVKIQWTDSDPDSDAKITLWYEGSNGEVDTIATDLSEDADGVGDMYTWHISALPVGDYLVKAVITDEENRTDVTAAGKVKIIPFEGHVLPTLITSDEINEGGNMLAKVEVVLDRAPYAGSTVTVNLAVSDSTEAEIVSVEQDGETKPSNYLYFTEENWNKPFTITVKGVNDCDVDGNTFVDIVLNNVVSDDTGFNGIDPEDITLVNMDDEVAGQALFICSYEHVSQIIQGDNLVTTLKAKLKNVGDTLFSVQSSLESLDERYIVSDGQVLNFEDVVSNQLATSLDSITISHDKNIPFDTSSFKWTYKVVDDRGDALPSGWSAKDIGWVWKKGSTSVEDGKVKVKASGLDIWSVGDSFHYISRTLSGDGEIVARINKLEKSHKWAKAGVMIRETDWVGSKHAFLLMTPDQGVDFQYRSSTSWVTKSKGLKSYEMGSWLKLKRVGNLFTAYVSEDREIWTEISSVSISMNANVKVGLAVTSHHWFKYTNAEFEQMWVEEY